MGLQIVTRNLFLRYTFLKRYGKRKTIVEFTCIYANPVQNDSP